MRRHVKILLSDISCTQSVTQVRGDRSNIFRAANFASSNFLKNFFENQFRFVQLCIGNLRNKKNI